MTTKTDDIKLPPLPVAVPWHKGYDIKSLENYGRTCYRAAVESDRQRSMPSDDEISDLWAECTIDRAVTQGKTGTMLHLFARGLLSRYGSDQPAALAAEYERGRHDGWAAGWDQAHGQPAASAEVDAWRERFPAYEYRPQDECVSLKLSTPAASAEPDWAPSWNAMLAAARNAGWSFTKSEDGIVRMVPLVHGEAQVASASAAPVAQKPVAWIRTTDITEFTDTEPETDGWTALVPVVAQPSVPDIPSAMRFAAQVVELYDDATMGGDYMIDSGDCSRILNALADYFSKFAPVAQKAAHRWPFVESPGEFTSRLKAALGEFHDLLPAVRFVLIENPPTFTVSAAQEPATNTHIDDDAVDHFAAAMKEKLAHARAKGRHGWRECAPADLSAMLRAHVEKGDPRDVANFCMFLWSLGQPISAAQAQPSAQDREDAGRYRWLRDLNGVDGSGVEIFINDEAHGPGHLTAQIDAARAAKGVDHD